jgi:hypothetical protein
MSRQGTSPQKSQDALIARAGARAAGALSRTLFNFFATARAGAPVNPGNLTVGTAATIDLFAVLIPPGDPGGDMVDLFAVLNYTLSAPDVVALGITTAPNATVSGGATVDNGIHYETGQGAGQPLVITSDAPSPEFAYNANVAAGFQTITIAQSVKVPPPGASGFSIIRARIGAAGGATFTAMSLSFSGKTTFPLFVP